MQDYPISLMNLFAEDAQRRLRRDRALRALDARQAQHADAKGFLRHFEDLLRDDE